MLYLSFALIAIGLALAGCAAQQQAMVQQATTCLTAAYNSPEAAPLRPHMPYNPTDASLAQLSDTAFANPTEAAAIAAAWPHFHRCDQQLVDRLSQLAPTIAPIFERSYAAGEDDAVALMQRHMTWGEFSRRRRDRTVAGREALVAEESRLAAQQQARVQAAIQGLAAAAAISEASRPTFPRATFTSCTQQGAFMNCVQQ